MESPTPLISTNEPKGLPPSGMAPALQVQEPNLSMLPEPNSLEDMASGTPKKADASVKPTLKPVRRPKSETVPFRMSPKTFLTFIGIGTATLWIAWQATKEEISYAWLMSAGEHAPAMAVDGAPSEPNTEGGTKWWLKVKFITKSKERIAAIMGGEYAEPDICYDVEGGNKNIPLNVKYCPTNPQWCVAMHKDHSALSAWFNVGGTVLIVVSGGAGLIALIYRGYKREHLGLPTTDY